MVSDGKAAIIRINTTAQNIEPMTAVLRMPFTMSRLTDTPQPAAMAAAVALACCILSVALA
jgi:hypothetical protein